MEEDNRFSHIVTDPKFRHIPKASRKVKIDKRFQSMFHDKSFAAKYTVDKRGRPINHSAKEDLKRYYDLSSEESESDEESQSDEDEEVDQPIAGKFVKAPASDEKSIAAEDSELYIKNKADKKVAGGVKKKLKNLNIDYARGESTLFSESSSDDEEPEDEADASDGEGIEHEWGEFDADAETTEEATKRLAACNMDWDRIRATDLMVIFNSFTPAGGLVESVVIYPSEFGKKRMQEEEVTGPIELVKSDNTKENDAKNDEENEEGSTYHMEKLRKYQLNRLKYYYAVISFDSVETASKVYTECDGMEYESSSTKLDLRFIPDDMTFDDEPKEVCDKLPEAAKYQPRFFTTTALQQAKVDLTWDETNPDRLEFAKKLQSGDLNNLTDADLQTYLGSSSGEESAEEEFKEENSKIDDEFGDPICKYRALLSEIQEKEKQKQDKDIQMEVKWDIDLQDKREKLVLQKLEEKEEKTPFQKYLDKRKAKRKEKREQRKKGDGLGSDEDDDSDIPDGVDMNDPYFAEEFNNPEFKKKPKTRQKPSLEEQDDQNNAELELLFMNEDDGKRHFSLNKIQEQDSNTKKKSKKRMKKDTNESKKDDFAINIDDNRFSALFTSHHYNIDPTNPHFKKTKNMELLISEKIKRRNTNSDCGPVPEKKVRTSDKNAELNVLVKSVKQKTLNYSNKNK